jgi:hypothetical protein
VNPGAAGGDERAEDDRLIREPDSTLALHLWDLRAQLEAQLRCLTKVHRWVDDFPTLPAEQRAQQKREILENLEEIRSTSEIVRGIATAAISAADESLRP